MIQFWNKFGDEAYMFHSGKTWLNIDYYNTNKN